MAGEIRRAEEKRDVITPAETLAAIWLEVAWPLMWYGGTVGALALMLVPLLRRVSLTAAIIVGLGALAKFSLPPVAQWPIALVDQAASRLLPGALVDAPAPLIVTIALVHVAGAAAALMHLAMRTRRVRGWRRRAVRLPDGPLHDDFVAASSSWTSAPPRAVLLVSSDVEAPVAVGVWRPAVIVPHDFDSVARATRRAVLAHELAHHHHRDLLIEWAIAVTCAVWWFHPVVHQLARTVRELREERCDATVVSSGLVDAGTYCEALLEIAASPHRTLALSMRSTHGVGSRVRRLLADQAPGQRARRGAMALALAFVALSVPAASERWRPDPLLAPKDGVVIRHVVRTEISANQVRRP